MNKLSVASIVTLLPMFLIVVFFYTTNVNSYMLAGLLYGPWVAWLLFPPLLLGSLAMLYVYKLNLWMFFINSSLVIILYIIIMLYPDFHLWFRYDTRIIGIILVFFGTLLVYGSNISVYFYGVKFKKNSVSQIKEK